MIGMRHVSIFVVLMLLSSHDTAGSPPNCSDNKLNLDDWVRKYLESSETVFLGEVISIDSPRFDTPPSDPDKHVESTESKPAGASSMDELLKSIEAGQASSSDPNIRINSFEVLRSWKEAKLPVVRTKGSVNSARYGLTFEKGQSYLVFADNYDGKFYRVSANCSFTLFAADAAERIEILNELVPSP